MVYALIEPQDVVTKPCFGHNLEKNPQVQRGV